MAAKGAAGAGKVYDYYGNCSAVICRGPVYGLEAITIDSKEEWPGSPAWKVGENATVSPPFFRRYGGKTWACTFAHTTSTITAPPNSLYWTEYRYDRGSADNSDITAISRGLFTHYWGTQTQTQDAALAGSGNSLGEDHPRYLGIDYVVGKQILFGRARSSVPTITETLRRTANQSIVTGAAADLIDGQCNPICAFLEIATDVVFGVGIPTSQIDATSFQAVADYLYSINAITYCSPLIDRQTTLKALADQFAAMGDVWFRYNSATRKIEAGYWIRDDYPTYVDIFEDDLAEPPELSSEGWEAAKTGIVINFSDRERGFKTSSDKYDDPRTLQVVGENRRDTIDRPFITRRTQAVNYAAEYLRTHGCPEMTGKIVVRREKFKDIRPGSWINLHVNVGFGLFKFFQVLSRTIPRRGPITLEIRSIQGVGFADSIQVPGSTVPTVLPTTTVPEMDQIRFFIAPPRLVGRQGDWMTLIAARPAPDVVGANIWFDENDPPVEYSQLATIRSFGVKGSLQIYNPGTEPWPLMVNFPNQVDLEKLGDTITPVQATDDTLLLIVFQLSGPSIAENSQKIPIFSIFSVDHIVPSVLSPGSGNYDVYVYGNRQGTVNEAFGSTPSNCEAWLIYRSALTFFSHQGLTRLYDNAVANDPALTFNANFVVQPFTAYNERDFDDCNQYGFGLPHGRKGSPTITIIDPDWSTEPEPWKKIETVVGGAYPTYTFKVRVDDVDNDVVSVSASITPPGGSETIVYSRSAEPRASQYFEVVWHPTIDGIHTFSISATDYAGNTVTQTVVSQINVNTAATVPIPIIKNTLTGKIAGSVIPSGVWLHNPSYWKIKVPIAGATIEYKWVNIGDAAPVSGYSTSTTDIDVGATTGFNSLGGKRLWVRGSKTGLATSAATYYDQAKSKQWRTGQL